MELNVAQKNCSVHLEQYTHKWLPWLVCLSASLFFFYEFVQGNMFASIADNIMSDFHITAEKMAYLSSVYYVANVLFLCVAGYLLDRYSVKKILMGAMLLCVASTFVLAQAQSFYVSLICRFMTGIGSAFCLLGPVRIASRWFLPQQMAMMTGCIVTVAMLGGMMAQYPMTYLVIHLGWRQAVWVVGWMGVAMWILMGIGIIERDAPQGEATESRAPVLAMMKRAYTNGHTVRIALLASLMNMAIAVFGAMMGSLYLMQRLQIDKAWAASINGMLFLGAIIGGPAMGRWSDRLGQRLLPMRVGLVGSLTIVLWILYFPVSAYLMYVLFFLLGFFTSAQVISYAYVAESQPYHMTAMAVSVVSICMQGGYVLFQNLFSHLLGWHGGLQHIDGIPVYSLGDYQSAALMLPIGLLVAWSLMWGVRETYCRRQDEC